MGWSCNRVRRADFPRAGGVRRWVFALVGAGALAHTSIGASPSVPAKLDVVDAAIRDGRLAAMKGVEGASAVTVQQALEQLADRLGETLKVGATRESALREEIRGLESALGEQISDVEALRRAVEGIAARLGAEQSTVAGIVDASIATLQRAMEVEVARRVGERFGALESQVRDLRSSYEVSRRDGDPGGTKSLVMAGEVVAVAQAAAQLQRMAQMPASSIIDPETFKIQTRIKPNGQGGMRGRTGSARGHLYAYVDGKEYPLGNQVIEVTSSLHENGPQTVIGQFRTDANGRYFFELRIPSKGESDRMYLHYRYPGSDTYRSAQIGPVRVGISA